MSTAWKRTLAVVVALVLVAGCGGKKENGVDKLSTQAALAKIQRDLAAVRTVHLRGSFTDSGKTFGIDARLTRTGGSGSLTVAGGRLDIVRVGSDAYLRGDATALTASGAPSAEVALVAGKWIKGSASSGDLASLAGLFDLEALTKNLLTPSGTLKKGVRTSVHGQTAYTLIDTGTDGGTLWVALTGPALPLRVQNTGANGGSIDFLDYDAKVTVTAPSGALDISQLGH